MNYDSERAQEIRRASANLFRSIGTANLSHIEEFRERTIEDLKKRVAVRANDEPQEALGSPLISSAE
jgi:hypothetical protein